MYKEIEYEGKKYPYRVTNIVVGYWQEETGKYSLRQLNYYDIKILLHHALLWGHEFVGQKFTLTERDIKLMVDDKKIVKGFVQSIPEFFSDEYDDTDEDQPKQGKAAAGRSKTAQKSAGSA